MNGFDWDAIFIWDLSWFTSWSLSWNTSLPGTLGGTAGGLLFLIFPLGPSMPPCVHFLVWIMCLLVLDSVVHKLNHVQHK